MTQQILQIIMAGLGAFGFSILFNIRGKKILLATIGGALSYSAYLVAFSVNQDPVFAVFLGTVFAATTAEVLARIFKAPVIILLVPMIIPLLPGGNFYYAMHHFVFNEMEEFSVIIQLVLKETSAIAGGIIIVTFLAQFATKLKNYFAK